jgi:hypothetical protein
MSTPGFAASSSKSNRTGWPRLIRVRLVQAPRGVLVTIDP